MLQIQARFLGSCPVNAGIGNGKREIWTISKIHITANQKRTTELLPFANENMNYKLTFQIERVVILNTVVKWSNQSWNMDRKTVICLPLIVIILYPISLFRCEYSFWVDLKAC
jgi:hypothetical protein